MHYNTISLHNLVSKVESLERTFLNSVSTGSQGGTYVSSCVPFPPKSPPSQIQSRSASVQHDTRDSNIILFGLPESRSIVETKSTVDEVLEFLFEKPVPIRNVFR